MEELAWYKLFVKSKVILFIGLLYIPIVLLVFYIDVQISAVILHGDSLRNFIHFFHLPLWKISLLVVLQHFTLCFLFGLVIGLRNTILRNRDFFLR